jgi:hypothetical protein
MWRLAALHVVFERIAEVFKGIKRKEDSSHHSDIEAPRKNNLGSDTDSQDVQDIGLELFNEHADLDEPYKDDHGTSLDNKRALWNPLSHLKGLLSMLQANSRLILEDLRGQ